MHLAKISNVPVLFLVLFSFDFSCCAPGLLLFVCCEASGMLQFSIQRLLLSPLTFHLLLPLFRHTLGRGSDTSPHYHARRHPWPQGQGVKEFIRHFPRF